MTDTHHMVADIRQVGGPRRASLELRGTVLVYHQHGWAGSASVYIPIEWVSVSSRYRNNMNYLVCLSLLLLALVSLLSGLLLEVTSGESPSLLTLLAFAVPAALCCGVSVLCLFRFLKRHRTTVLAVDTGHTGMRVEFWHTPAEDPKLDALLDRLSSLRERIEDVTQYPIHTSHTWYRMRPFRAVLLKGLTYSLVLYIPVSLIADYLDRHVLLLFLLLPPAFYGGHYALMALRNLGNPKSVRAAVRSYNKGEVGQADSFLRDTLAAHPDHAESLLLSVYVNVEQQQFDRAFAQCRKLAAFDRDHADDLVKEIWAIKRMHDRMDAES
ncbi:MAG: hypothetical protein IT364_27225 [Candidatus Hydrogenedentes bacterium]|nr:hypothetical protein [Candidatus Hydrogenedentota bacterium]